MPVVPTEPTVLKVCSAVPVRAAELVMLVVVELTAWTLPPAKARHARVKADVRRTYLPKVLRIVSILLNPCRAQAIPKLTSEPGHLEETTASLAPDEGD
jgi:hypothetical protein